MLIRAAICCLVGILLAVVTAWRIRRNPNAISNGFGIELAVLLLLAAVLELITFAVRNGYLTGEEVLVPIVFVWAYGRSIVYLLLGVALFINGVLMVRREGLALAHALPFVWGALMLFVAYWDGLGPGGADYSGTELGFNIVVFISMMVRYVPFALFGVLFSNIICHRAARPPERRYIVALGCGLTPDGGVTPLLRGRLDAALAEWERGGKQAKIICSGGQGPDEVMPEAQAMANYLYAQGVPRDAVLLESESTTTEENLRFSRQIMRSRDQAESATCAAFDGTARAASDGAQGGNGETREDGSGSGSEGALGAQRGQGSSPAHCTVATNTYHCLRAAMFARRLGMNVSCVGGRTAPFYYPAAFFREYIALVMRNRYAVAIFFGLTLLRFALYLNGWLPDTIF